MAVSSAFTRAGAAVLLAALGACSSVDEEDVFGYEESFIIPQPDMVPVTPDDKPGRTVDEMLDLKQSVTVKKAVYQEPAESDQMYEHAGRFGSKEKIALRKGLNAPDSGIVYGSRKRRGAEVVRPLELKEQDKDPLLAVSEEEMLAEIIAPKTEEIAVIEVVSSEGTKDEAKQPETLPAAQDKLSESAVPAVVPLVALTPAKQPAAAQPVVEKPEPVLPAVTLKAPETPEKIPERFKPLVPPSPVVQLTPPSGGSGIVLTPPSDETSETSVEIFLEE